MHNLALLHISGDLIEVFKIYKGYEHMHNYALYPVIRLYCGLILLEYARFF